MHILTLLQEPEAVNFKPLGPNTQGVKLCMPWGRLGFWVGSMVELQELPG